VSERIHCCRVGRSLGRREKWPSVCHPLQAKAFAVRLNHPHTAAPEVNTEGILEAADTITVLRKEVERLRAFIDNDADWKFSAKRRLQILRELRAENVRQREALADMIELCMHAKPDAFCNGVTDSTGTVDQGDFIAGRIIDAARAAREQGEE